MKCIIFQKFTLNYLFFLFFLVISIIRKRLTDPLFENKNKKSEFFFLMYIAILCKFLTIIPFLISKYLSKRRNKKQENEQPMNTSTNKIVYIYTEYKNKNIFKYTIIVSIFDFVGEASIFLFYFLNDKKEVISKYALRTYLIFNTVTQYMTSYILLKSYFYKHHWLSMFINIFCVVISLTMDIIMIVGKNITDYQYYIFVLMRLIRIIIFSFKNSYTKIALTSGLLSPYLLLLYKAIFETIFLGIFSIPFIFIKITEDNIDNESIFVGFKEYLTKIKFLYSFLLLICSFFYRLFNMLIIDQFSPNHLPLANTLDSFGDTLSLIIRLAVGHQSISWTYYIIFIVYIILFIAAMIHNEIFIINRCGLNEKTKLFLDVSLNEEKKNQYLIPGEENENEEENKDNEENKDIEKNENLEENSISSEDKIIE